MSSPNSNTVQSVNDEPRTSGSNSSLQNPFALKRRYFNSSPPANSCSDDARRPDQNVGNSSNGSVENSLNPESSDGVTSVSHNKDDVTSSDAIATNSNSVDVVSSSDNVELSADSTANQPDSTTSQHSGNASSSQPRVACQYGEKCYRRNNTHHEIFAHPGDSDYRVKVHSVNQNLLDIVPDENAPECRYGQMCYRKNPDHFRQKKHSQLSNTGRPKRKRTRPNSPTSSNAISSSESEELDFSGDDDEDYVPPDSD